MKNAALILMAFVTVFGFSLTAVAESGFPGGGRGGFPGGGGFGGMFGGSTVEAVPATESDVPYASNSSSQVLNVYIPETEADSAYPVIALVHGGGFVMETQNESLIQPVISKALEKGRAVVSVDYRKSSEAVFPAALSDVKASAR